MDWFATHASTIRQTGWDPLVWLLCVQVVFRAIAGVMFLLEPMRCPWKHTTLHRFVAAYFFVTCYAQANRAYQRMAAISQQGGPMISANLLLVGELAATVCIIAVAVVLMYDWWRQRQLSRFGMACRDTVTEGAS